MVGNKTDLVRREVTFEEGQERANLFDIKFVETSAKDLKNVMQAFEDMTREINKK